MAEAVKTMDGCRVPSGWTIKTYRHMNVPQAEFQEMDAFFAGLCEGKKGEGGTGRTVAFGTFDRIQIHPVESFAKFSEEANRHDWYGSSQTILLYSWPNKYGAGVFQWDSNAERLRISAANAGSAGSSFLGISFCYISDWARDATNLTFREVLNQCNERILQYVDEFNRLLDLENAASDGGFVHEHVNAEVFGSLSTAELVIFWSARQYTDILYLMGCIRDLRLTIQYPIETGDDGVSNKSVLSEKSGEKAGDTAVSSAQSDEEAGETPAFSTGEHSVFRTTYTVVSYPDNDVSRADDRTKTRMREILGTTYIQFATQDMIGEKSFGEFRKYIEKCLKNAGKLLEEDAASISLDALQLRRSAGEYDLVVEVKSRYLPPLFCVPAAQASEPTFNIRNREYNQFVLYTTSRLAYEPSDLPAFTQKDSLLNDQWTSFQERRDLYEDGRAVTADTWKKRPAHLKKIQDKRKEKFEELIRLVRRHIPAVSNLSLELHQLFSDYIQCSCSSADYSWIEDFDELFVQTMARVRYSVEGIPIDRDDSPAEGNGEQVRQSVEVLGNLVRALHQQISHITTSGKHFFREQETHFGYTAQHDLVLHALYDIIKQLIGYIYHNTDTKTQSVLYPLINFQAENRITSEIYAEESEESFARQSSPALRARIMVIHIPLDAVDNLMYYLPMLVHEAYHYAAPKDREERNRFLAKFVIFQTLRYGFETTFADLMRQNAENARTGSKDRLAMDEMVSAATVSFDKCLSSVIYKFLDENEIRIHKGILEYAFRSVSKESREELLHTSILRRWFVDWLQGWLCNEKKVEESEAAQQESENEGATTERKSKNEGYENLVDIFPDLFPRIILTLQENVVQRKVQEKSFFERVFLQSLEEYKDLLCLARASEGKANAGNGGDLLQDIVDRMAAYAVDSEGFEELMLQMDEVMPDIAMATTVGMPAAGYMLQVALDLDKQLIGGKEFESDHIRFGAVLHWLLKKAVDEGADAEDGKLSAKKGEDETKRNLPVEKRPDFWEKAWDRLQEEKAAFLKLYLAFYHLAAGEGETEEEKQRVHKRAEGWCQAFQDIWDEYTGAFGAKSVGVARKWIDYYIEEGMVRSSLTLPEEKAEERRRAFEEPYHKYLGLLNPEYVEKLYLPDNMSLFTLSVETILGFQHHRSLKKLCKLLSEPGAGVANAGQGAAFPEKTRFSERPFYEWVVKTSDPRNYDYSIWMALKRLYNYREEDGLPTATGMWYRGVTHAEYPVLPSGFVHHGEDMEMLYGRRNSKDANPMAGSGDPLDSKYPRFSFLESILHHYEAFRYASEGSTADISPSQYYRTFNYLTLMQHYRQHTNLLDWSEDFFASTYFALEDEVNINDRYPYERVGEKRDKLLRDKDSDAVLYILDPVRFNIACEEIEKKNDKVLDASPLGEGFVRADIPNLSIDENVKTFGEYCDPYGLSREEIGDVILFEREGVKDENGSAGAASGGVHDAFDGEGGSTGKTVSGQGSGKSKDKDGTGEKKEINLVTLTTKPFVYRVEGQEVSPKQDGRPRFHLPRAVYAAKLNSRIRAQSGLFVAFSLKSAPAVWRGDEIPTNHPAAELFDYQSLERIQDYYMDVMGKKPFLMKIIIPASLKEGLGNLFYNLGLSKERIYPEMDNQRNR